MQKLCGTGRSAETSSTMITSWRGYSMKDYRDRYDIAWNCTGVRGKTLAFITWRVIRQDVVDQLAARFAIDREPLLYPQAEQPRWKQEQPMGDYKVDNSRRWQQRFQVELQDTVNSDGLLPFMALQLTNTISSSLSGSSSSTSVENALLWRLGLNTTPVTFRWNVVPDHLFTILINHNTCRVSSFVD